ncbi:MULTISPECIES: hypothetical protein [unclassified Novosphingobium]|uniref:hypothetical protein n=1 Tax=unclassified Novosphingobium TaxID=2644732 RepID=UPI00135686EA|nr:MULTISPECIES: hypothetical protein [unclassified Novosphingobium]
MQTLHRLIAAIEPWYDWRQRDIFRLDTEERDFSDESEGTAFRFDLQWLGVHLAFEIGRTPRKIPAAEVAANKARLARQKEASA